MSGEAVPVPPNWHKFDSCGICACGVKWTSIMNVDVDDGWPEKATDAANDGFAHIGNRTPQEARYVVWLRERQQAAIAEATGWRPVVREQLPTDQVTFMAEPNPWAWLKQSKGVAATHDPHAAQLCGMQSTPYYAAVTHTYGFEDERSVPASTVAAYNVRPDDPQGATLEDNERLKQIASYEAALERMVTRREERWNAWLANQAS